MAKGQRQEYQSNHMKRHVFIAVNSTWSYMYMRFNAGNGTMNNILDIQNSAENSSKCNVIKSHVWSSIVCVT